MKKQQKEEKKQIKNKKQMMWKIVAIAVIIIFLLIVAGVIVKIFKHKSSLVKPTQAQIDGAIKIAAKKLQSSGVNASSFQIRAGEKMRKLHEDGTAKSIIQVSFF